MKTRLFARFLLATTLSFAVLLVLLPTNTWAANDTDAGADTTGDATPSVNDTNTITEGESVDDNVTDVSEVNSTPIDDGFQGTNYAQDGGTLMNAINDLAEEAYEENGLSYFREALLACDLLDQVLDVVGNGTYTVFAPTNAAVKANRFFMLYTKGIDDPKARWYDSLRATLLHHIVPNQELKDTDIFDTKTSKLETLLTPITNSTISVSQWDKNIGGAKLVSDTSKINIATANGILQVIDQVISPQFMQQPFGMVEKQIELDTDPEGRVSLIDVVTVTQARDILNTVNNDGLTFAACRIRAFNRLEEYLPQTINDSMNVTWGELMNKTFANETRVNFFEYSLVPKNIYFDQIEDGHVELITPMSGAKCNGANMWITKFKGVLCFNNGCTIETPDLRTWYASNGVGYIVDKCQVCPGVAMLVGIAAEYTNGIYNLRDTAQFFTASGWNLRDLRQSVGNPDEDITMFAPINSGWGFFNLEDTTRLAGDEWNPHKLDLLRHFLVQGRYTYNDLYAKYKEKNGPYNLTTLTKQQITVDYDSSEKNITINGGQLFFKDVQGVDGLVHFVTEVPLPESMTDSVFDIAAKRENYTTQTTLIKAETINADLKRLLPVTLLIAPNEYWVNKKIEMEEISKSVLENMIFGKLLWCDTLRALKGQYVESHNEKYWSITLNDDNMPCFEFRDGTEANNKVLRSCIVRCDILARNGLVHEIDNVLMYELPETVPPKESGAHLPGSVGDNYEEIMKNSDHGSTNGANNVNSDSGFQRPIPTEEDITGDTSDSLSTAMSTLVMSGAIIISMIILL